MLQVPPKCWHHCPHPHGVEIKSIPLEKLDVISRYEHKKCTVHTVNVTGIPDQLQEPLSKQADKIKERCKSVRRVLLVQ
jgi:hypothetical protein